MNKSRTYYPLSENYKIDTEFPNSKHLDCKSILCSLQQLPLSNLVVLVFQCQLCVSFYFPLI